MIFPLANDNEADLLMKQREEMINTKSQCLKEFSKLSSALKFHSDASKACDQRHYKTSSWELCITLCNLISSMKHIHIMVFALLWESMSVLHNT